MLTAGTRLGSHEVLALLGQGGMQVVLLLPSQAMSCGRCLRFC